MSFNESEQINSTHQLHYHPHAIHGYDHLSLDPNSFESVIVRLSGDLDFTNHDDPLTADFVLIHSPAKFVTLVLSILIFIKVSERIMLRRSEGFQFARPAFLVNCGLTFGINGCGALMALAVTEGGHHLFQCIDRTSLSLSTVFCRYLIFVYLSTLVYDLFSLLLPILQKQTVSNHIITRQLVWIFIAYVIMRYQPTGFPIMVPLIHSLLKVLNNMLSVMNTASKELNPEVKWSKRLDVFSILLHFLMLAHQVYFATTVGSHFGSAAWVSKIVTTGAAIQTISVLSAPKGRKGELTDFILG